MVAWVAWEGLIVPRSIGYSSSRKDSILLLYDIFFSYTIVEKTWSTICGNNGLIKQEASGNIDSEQKKWSWSLYPVEVLSPGFGRWNEESRITAVPSIWTDKMSELYTAPVPGECFVDALCSKEAQSILPRFEVSWSLRMTEVLETLWPEPT